MYSFVHVVIIVFFSYSLLQNKSPSPTPLGHNKDFLVLTITYNISINTKILSISYHIWAYGFYFVCHIALWCGNYSRQVWLVVEAGVSYSPEGSTEKAVLRSSPPKPILTLQWTTGFRQAETRTSRMRRERRIVSYWVFFLNSFLSNCKRQTGCLWVLLSQRSFSN